MADFDYRLPPELIAQQPARPRDSSRLLLLDKRTGKAEHRRFSDLADELKSGDVLVLNNSRVFPARLFGKKQASGGVVEVFLHRPLAADVWECLVRGRLRPQTAVDLGEGLVATARQDNGDGTWQVSFNLRGAKFWAAVRKIGQLPLPPYIKRERILKSDQERYQTVYADARKTGSVAAPTAGLHFTPRLLARLRARGVEIVMVTLHVGLGTFAAVKAERIRDHRMHAELAHVPGRAARVLARAEKEGRRIIAVGTTSCRTLEAWGGSGRPKDPFWTDIFIRPGYRFRVVQGLITNFHLPRSTLLMLVSALAGKANIDRAYREAVRRRYRFFSYGDAMFIR